MSAGLNPDFILQAYRLGVFPMAESRRADASILWIRPHRRAVIPLDGFHAPRRLMQTLRNRQALRFAVNRNFTAVIDACAAPRSNDSPHGSWINPALRRAYCDLHAAGSAHSLEVSEDDKLTGGLFGVSIGAAFFGESMFHHRRDASKLALVALIDRLRRGGFQLLDIQFMTEHLQRFGAVEISRSRFQRRLDRALRKQADFKNDDDEFDADQLLQSLSQTSNIGCSSPLTLGLEAKIQPDSSIADISSSTSSAIST